MPAADVAQQPPPADPPVNSSSLPVQASPPVPPPGNGDSARSPHESDSPKRRASQTKADKRAKKRRKVNRACVYCQRSHMTCDEGRPCGRCVKRSIGHLCHDEPPPKDRETQRRSRANSDTHQPQPAGETGGAQLGSQPAAQLPQPSDTGLNLAPASLPPPNAASTQVAPPAGPEGFPLSQPFFNYNEWNSNSQNPISDMSFHPSYMFNTSELSNEYNLLNDFLNNSILDDALDENVYPQDAGQLHPPAPPSHSLASPQSTNGLYPDNMNNNSIGPASTPNGMFATVPSATTPSSNFQPNSAQAKSSQSNAATEKAREKYFMTAADPAGIDTPEERMNRLLQAKYDAGLLKPYNYPKGYQKLQDWMAKNVQPASKERIVFQFNKFRPKFRQRIQKLTDIELVLVEMWFERRLMEYDRIFASMAIPACCWRRTGEIFRGNREMSELVSVPREELRDGKLALYDILTEDSLVSYWEKFTEIAFDDTQKAILTSCSLKPPASEPQGQVRRCCFSFTVNRDLHGVPTLIVGNFLPVTQINT